MEDPRQSKFHKVTGGLKRYKDEKKEVVVVSTRGRFTASAVNLGELYDLIVDKLKGKFFVEQDIKEIIKNNIQRLKYLKVYESENHWNIDFKTKDDFSWYEYGFSIYKKQLKVIKC